MNKYDKSYRWWRGQVHIHTNETEPANAISWYKYHGYNFAIITDLNYATPVEALKSVYDAPGQFIVIKGIELHLDSNNKIYDTMGYGGRPEEIEEFRDSATYMIELPDELPVDTYNRQAKMIRNAGGIPSIAHPNLTWALTVEDLLKTDPELIKHFEVRTSEPGMNDKGGGGHPSTEEIWDQVLSTGRIMFCPAADDSHHFNHFGPKTFWWGSRPVTQAPSLPGRTSVYVYAPELTSEAIISAIDNGEFYSVKHDLTLPIEFVSYKVSNEGIYIELSDQGKDIGWPVPGGNTTLYNTYFIGRNGKVLKKDETLNPSYNFQGDELYVRARVECSDGAVAWTQPIFV